MPWRPRSIDGSGSGLPIAKLFGRKRTARHLASRYFSPRVFGVCDYCGAGSVARRGRVDRVRLHDVPICVALDGARGVPEPRQVSGEVPSEARGAAPPSDDSDYTAAAFLLATGPAACRASPTNETTPRRDRPASM